MCDLCSGTGKMYGFGGVYIPCMECFPETYDDDPEEVEDDPEEVEDGPEVGEFCKPIDTVEKSCYNNTSESGEEDV